jgi:hypothetical protein
MNKSEETPGVDSLVRLVLGTGVTVLTGILFWGPGAFARGQMYMCVSIGIVGALVYIVCRIWGVRFAAGAAVLLSMMNAALAQRLYVTIWSETLGMLLMLVLLWHVLTTWKIERPIIGRLLLLGPLFALSSFVLTLVFRLAFFPQLALVTAKNQAMNHFKYGVGLGLGLELAELIIRWWHRSLAHSTEAVKQN